VIHNGCDLGVRSRTRRTGQTAGVLPSVSGGPRRWPASRTTSSTTRVRGARSAHPDLL